MSNEDIIRAWKDEEYRQSLSEEQKALLPEDPAGIVDVTDEESNQVQGGWSINLSRLLRCGRVFTATAECRCARTTTGRCRCPF